MYIINLPLNFFNFCKQSDSNAGTLIKNGNIFCSKHINLTQTIKPNWQLGISFPNIYFICQQKNAHLNWKNFLLKFSSQIESLNCSFPTNKSKKTRLQIMFSWIGSHFYHSKNGRSKRSFSNIFYIIHLFARRYGGVEMRYDIWQKGKSFSNREFPQVE